MNRIDPTVQTLPTGAPALGDDAEMRAADRTRSGAEAFESRPLGGRLLAGPRALVVADDPLVRQGLNARLGAIAVGEASCTDDLTGALARTDANVVLWDLGPEAATEGELTGQVSRLPVPVVALLPAGATRVALLGAGVAGVIGREVGGQAIATALLAVHHGLHVVDRQGIDELERPAPTEVVASRVDGLTNREHEVVQLMAEGLSNKQIADRLGISAHTAKFHVNAVLGKLHASTRTEAVVRAVQRGVVML